MMHATSTTSQMNPAPASLYCEAILRVETGLQPGPLVIDVSRSGTSYPPEFLPNAAYDSLHKKLSPYVERLVLPSRREGATVLMALFPPSFVDPNRPIDDIDPAMLDRAWPTPLRPQQASQQAGSGLIHTLGADYRPLYSGPVAVSDIRNRVDNYYRPYHDTLSDLLAQRRENFGIALQLSCHSMSSIGPRDGLGRPDICLGDLDGVTTSPAYRDLAADIFGRHGYEVALNRPFRGNELIRRHAAPADRIHSLQVEVRRDLYLDESTRLPHDGMARLQACFAELAAAVRQLSAADLPLP
jgi:N-formylglutamate deformylase